MWHGVRYFLNRLTTGYKEYVMTESLSNRVPFALFSDGQDARENPQVPNPANPQAWMGTVHTEQNAFMDSSTQARKNVEGH